MKKKLRKTLHRFNSLKLQTLPAKRYVKAEIRAVSDNYEDFNDMVFELGCDVLAKAYLKQMGV